MNKLPHMFRYRISSWKRHSMPEWIGLIESENQPLFMQLLQEGMHYYQDEHFPELGFCFFQIKTPDQTSSGWAIYLVSTLRCEDHNQLYQLYDELTNLKLDSFITEDDWNERLQ